jgi:hypothetical protein
VTFQNYVVALADLYGEISERPQVAEQFVQETGRFKPLERALSRSPRGGSPAMALIPAQKAVETQRRYQQQRQALFPQG